jgi:hypothetical protein
MSVFHPKRPLIVVEKQPGGESGSRRSDQLGQDKQAHIRGAMPANVFDKLRAMVMAGLAKLVEEVNQ